MRLQIMKLSKKIDAEPEKNLFQNILKDASGSNLMLRILEIEIQNSPNSDKISGDQNEEHDDITAYKSLMYTIQGYSKENLIKDDVNSPLELIQEEDENEDANQIPSSARPKLHLNKDQYFSS